jgi:cytochrome c oxidase cbb3-type subunit III
LALGVWRSLLWLALLCPPVFAQELLLAPPPAVKRDAMRDFLAIGEPPDPKAVARGTAIFSTQCSFCHGANATGGHSGPSLIQSVLVRHDEGSGKLLGALLSVGRPDKGMPPFAFTQAQVLDIAAFLVDRYQAVANRSAYKPTDIISGDASRGKSFFDARCARCHSPTQDLAHVASKFDPVALQNRFLYPSAPDKASKAELNKVLPMATVTLRSGTVQRGRLVFQDDFRVTLRDEDGTDHDIDLAGPDDYSMQVVDPLAEHETLLKKYTDADMHDVLAYLETLK